MRESWRWSKGSIGGAFGRGWSGPAYKDPATILQAPAPEHIVEAGLPNEAPLAQVAEIRRRAAALPPGGQLPSRRRRAGTFADGAMDGRGRLPPRAAGAHVLARIREGERNFADETTLPTLSRKPTP